jgi:phage tail-like protein
MTGELKDPYTNFNFIVEFDSGVPRAAFQQVTGFDSTVEVIEHREGGENTTMRKLPGKTSYSNIVLKWGMSEDTELYDWHRRCIEGEIERKNVTIFLLNRKGETVYHWLVVRAWPTKYDTPELNAEGSDVSIVTLELAHEGCIQEKG